MAGLLTFLTFSAFPDVSSGMEAKSVFRTVRNRITAAGTVQEFHLIPLRAVSVQNGFTITVAKMVVFFVCARGQQKNNPLKNPTKPKL
jgi:hypothetical protein